jgi:hypothetical protein
VSTQHTAKPKINKSTSIAGPLAKTCNSSTSLTSPFKKTKKTKTKRQTKIVPFFWCQ